VNETEIWNIDVVSRSLETVRTICVVDRRKDEVKLNLEGKNKVCKQLMCLGRGRSSGEKVRSLSLGSFRV